MQLDRCTALVTGGAVRIGRAICEALAARGCGVIVHCHRSRAEADELAGRIARAGGRAWVVQGALETERECQAVADAAWTAAGAVEVLVNNASVFHKDGLATADEDRLAGEFRVNLFAPVWLTRAFAARWRTGTAGTPRGKVVNLLDRRVAGVEAGCLPYLLSKHALAAFTRAAALELAPFATVNGVAPGPVLPPRRAGESGGGGRESGEENTPVFDYAGQVPLRRPCTPADVAAAAVFLLESDAITGQTVFVDGGQHLLASAV